MRGGRGGRSCKGLRIGYDVLEVLTPYKNRGDSRFVRIYADVKTKTKKEER